MSHTLILPSNHDSHGYNPENRASNYVTRLVEPLVLPHGVWAAKMVDVSYSTTWLNVEKNVPMHVNIYIASKYKKHVEANITLPAGYYKSTMDIMTYIGWQIDKALIGLNVENRLFIEHDERTKTLKVNTLGCIIVIMAGTEDDSPDIFKRLGFDNTTKADRAAIIVNIPRGDEQPPRPTTFYKENDMVEKIESAIKVYPKATYVIYGGIDFTTIFPSTIRTFDHMYVHCDIIQDTFIGNTRAPILGVVPIFEHEHSKRVMFEAPAQRWHQLKTNRIDSVRIKICDENGKEIHFASGNIIVRLAISQ